MSKRLQILLDDNEFRDLQRAARRERVTVSDWVREAIRQAWRRRSQRPTDRRVAAVREASRHTFPTADMPQLLREIEHGYLGPDEG
jgi:hypothetical protein